MATVTMKAPAPGGLSNKARELMEAINSEAGNIISGCARRLTRRRNGRGSVKPAAKARASSPPAASPSIR